MATYLGSIGLPVPPATNPADFMLDVVNKDFVSEEEVEKVLAKCTPIEDTAQINASVPEHHVHPLGAQIKVLLHKHAVLTLRDPAMYALRIGAFIFVSFFFGVLYWDSRKENQDVVFMRMFYMWWTSNIPPALGMLPLVAQYYESTVIKREVTDGSYKISTFVLANTLIQLPMMFVLAINNQWMSFVMGKWPWASIGSMTVTTAFSLWSFETFAQFSSLEADPALACANFVQFWFTSLLMNGWMVKAKDIIWPFRLLTHILPLRYTIEALAYRLFIEVPDYPGTLPCVGNCTRSFYCPDVSPNRCFGPTGEEILISFSSQYDAIKAEDRCNYPAPHHSSLPHITRISTSIPTRFRTATLLSTPHPPLYTVLHQFTPPKVRPVSRRHDWCRCRVQDRLLLPLRQPSGRADAQTRRTLCLIWL